MKKDAYYFSHDSNATNDPKIMLMVAQWGLEAYGIYWTIIEHLREQPNYTSHISILKALAMRYNSSEEKYRYVINDFGLFVIDENNFFSQSLIERMKHLDNKREKARQSALQRWNKCESNANALPSHTDRNASKVNKSKVNKNKVTSEDIYRSFNHLKITNSEIEKLKEKYTIEQINDILDRIENYKNNKKYVSLNLTVQSWLKKEYPELKKGNIRRWKVAYSTYQGTEEQLQKAIKEFGESITIIE